MKNFAAIIKFSILQIAKHLYPVIALSVVYALIFLGINWISVQVEQNLLASENFSFYAIMAVSIGFSALMIFLLAGIACQMHRVWAGEDLRHPWLPFAFPWGRSFGYFLRLLGFALAFIVANWLIFRLAGYIIVALQPSINPNHQAAERFFSLITSIQILSYILFIPISWLGLRFSPILPAYALKTKLSLSQAWEKTRQSSAALFMLALIYGFLQIMFIIINASIAQRNGVTEGDYMLIYSNAAPFSWTEYRSPLLAILLASLIHAVYRVNVGEPVWKTKRAPEKAAAKPAPKPSPKPASPAKAKPAPAAGAVAGGVAAASLAKTAASHPLNSLSKSHSAQMEKEHKAQEKIDNISAKEAMAQEAKKYASPPPKPAPRPVAPAPSAPVAKPVQSAQAPVQNPQPVSRRERRAQERADAARRKREAAEARALKKAQQKKAAAQAKADAQAKAQARAREQAEARAKLKADAKSQKQAQALQKESAKQKEQSAAKERAEAEKMKAKALHQERIKAEQEKAKAIAAKRQEEAAEKAKAEAAQRAKDDALQQERIKAEQEKAKAIAAKRQAEAEAKAKADAEAAASAKARAEREAKARAEEEAKAKAAAEQKAQEIAQAKENARLAAAQLAAEKARQQQSEKLVKTSEIDDDLDIPIMPKLPGK